MKTLTYIRSTAIGKANRLQTVARHIDTLRPAFNEWAAGEIYVCKKTGDYRYRFGDMGKSVTPWNSTAREVFTTSADLAFAAMVFADEQPAPAKLLQKSTKAAPVVTNRTNIIALASASKEEAA